MGDQVFEVVIPTEEEIEIRDGQRRTVSKKLFPGYVLVQMLMGDDSWYVVRNTPGVTGFAGSSADERSRPIPLDNEEVGRILRQMDAGTPRINIGFAVGESVRVIDGPFIDFVRPSGRDQPRQGQGPRAGVDVRPRDAGRARLSPGREAVAAGA